MGIIYPQFNFCYSRGSIQKIKAIFCVGLRNFIDTVYLVYISSYHCAQDISKENTLYTYIILCVCVCVYFHSLVIYFLEYKNNTRLASRIQ